MVLLFEEAVGCYTSLILSDSRKQRGKVTMKRLSYRAWLAYAKQFRMLKLSLNIDEAVPMELSNVNGAKTKGG